MKFWPQSVSDYQWPRALLTTRHAPSRWLASAVFHASYAAGRIVSLFRAHPPAILAIRTDGIGDAILAEPMMHSFARRFAGLKLHLWAPDLTCELLRAAPYIHRKMEIPRGFKEGNLTLFRSRSWRAKLGYNLGRWQFQTVAYLAHSPEPLGNWLLASARANQRWFVPGDTENQFAAQRQDTTRIATSLFGVADAFDFGRHDLTRNARISAQWGNSIEHRLPTVHLDNAAVEAAAFQWRIWQREMKEMAGETLIGLMPAASMAVKRYPLGAWAIVAAELWRSYRAVCALLGGSGDAMILEEISTRLGKTPHLKLRQPLDLPTMAGLVGSLDGLLTVDSGLAHLALAQDVPTVALVGGGHPGRFLPWPTPRKAVILNHSMPCEGCMNRCHLRRAECITRIDPMEIVRSMAGLLDPETADLPLRKVG